MSTIPPITRALIDALYSAEATAERKRIVADAVALIGPAFEGIDNFNQAGRTEPLTDALQRFTRQHALPVRIDTLLALAQRINELSAIAQQNALTADDLPTAGWGVPQEPQEPEADEPICTYGEQGGLWFAYSLDLDRGEYVVVNEGGDEVYADGSERDVQRWCELQTEGPECCECGKHVPALSPGHRCFDCEFADEAKPKPTEFHSPEDVATEGF